MSEHQLFHEEIYELCAESDFQMYLATKARPFLNTTRYVPIMCGIAIAWQKLPNYKVTPLKDITDGRMCVLI